MRLLWERGQVELLSNLTPLLQIDLLSEPDPVIRPRYSEQMTLVR